jgi:hypothetical protein
MEMRNIPIEETIWETDVDERTIVILVLEKFVVNTCIFSFLR